MCLNAQPEWFSTEARLQRTTLLTFGSDLPIGGGANPITQVRIALGDRSAGVLLNLQGFLIAPRPQNAVFDSDVSITARADKLARGKPPSPLFYLSSHRPTLPVTTGPDYISTCKAHHGIVGLPRPPPGQLHSRTSGDLHRGADPAGCGAVGAGLDGPMPHVPAQRRYGCALPCLQLATTLGSGAHERLQDAPVGHFRLDLSPGGQSGRGQGLPWRCASLLVSDPAA